MKTPGVKKWLLAMGASVLGGVLIKVGSVYGFLPEVIIAWWCWGLIWVIRIWHGHELWTEPRRGSSGLRKAGIVLLAAVWLAMMALMWPVTILLYNPVRTSRQRV